MKCNGDDESVRRLFREMRRRDEREAPSFEEVLSAQRNENRRGRAAFAWRAAAAAALLAVSFSAFFLQFSSKSEPPDEPATPTLIAQWRSPTDFLLDFPNQELLTTVPTFRLSLPDAAN